jgi:hypothetical protein
VFLTNALVPPPLKPFDGYADRGPIKNCCIQETTQQWDLGHSPQKPNGPYGRMTCSPCMGLPLMAESSIGTSEGECRQLPREAFEPLLSSLPLAA